MEMIFISLFVCVCVGFLYWGIERFFNWHAVPQHGGHKMPPAHDFNSDFRPEIYQPEPRPDNNASGYHQATNISLAAVRQKVDEMTEEARPVDEFHDVIEGHRQKHSTAAGQQFKRHNRRSGR